VTGDAGGETDGEDFMPFIPAAQRVVSQQAWFYCSRLLFSVTIAMMRFSIFD
jgi:hypothetical protein